MAKRPRLTNSHNITRGVGRGKDYVPYLRIQDVPSTGLATRVRGWKTGRVHHLLSKLEKMFFFTLEWSRFVVDIREQYPLDIGRTLAIAKDLGVRHPCLPGTNKPIVMTTDFVITSRRGLQIIDRARSVKPSSQLSSIRTLEKLEIERIYSLGV
jgi:TnsA endonuclease N terminal